jgi:hypothetical protein
MQFLTSLFGGSENTILTAVMALGIVLLLIVTGLWLLKLFFRASTNLTRGRNKRLTIVDQVALDQKRQLIIVRRDNVEHLILTGGPQDLVVESGIAVEKPGALNRRAAAPSPAAGSTPPSTERPVPSRPVTDALDAAQALVLTNPLPPTNSAADRLRDIGRPASQRGQVVTRTPSSLRHTGLMRPVSRMEPAAIIPINPDNSDHRRFDSAKTGPLQTGGQTRLGGGTYLGDNFKAEGT